MPEAARLHDKISHSDEAIFMEVFGAIGAVVGAVMVGAEVVGEVAAFFTGALTLPAVVGLGATLVTAGAQVAGTTSLGMFVGKTIGSYFHHSSGEIISAALTVFIGGQPAARGEADVAKCKDHDGSEVSKSVPVKTGRRIAEGSETVFIETFHAARRGDKGTCLYRISGGCDSVVIGGAKVQLLDIAASETLGLDKVMFWLGVVSGVGALRQAFAKGAVAGIAALLKMTGIVGASLGAGEVAKRWAGGKWGEGSEEQERATLTAQLGAGILAERFASSKSGSAMIDAAATRIAAEGAAARDSMAAFAAKMRGGFQNSQLEPAPVSGGNVPGVFEPEIVPRDPNSVSMDAWNPPKNEPVQMSNDNEGSGGARTGQTDKTSSGTPDENNWATQKQELAKKSIEDFRKETENLRGNQRGAAFESWVRENHPEYSGERFWYGDEEQYSSDGYVNSEKQQLWDYKHFKGNRLDQPLNRQLSGHSADQFERYQELKENGDIKEFNYLFSDQPSPRLTWQIQQGGGGAYYVNNAGEIVKMPTMTEKPQLYQRNK